MYNLTNNKDSTCDDSTEVDTGKENITTDGETRTSNQCYIVSSCVINCYSLKSDQLADHLNHTIHNGVRYKCLINLLLLNQSNSRLTVQVFN